MKHHGLSLKAPWNLEELVATPEERLQVQGFHDRLTAEGKLVTEHDKSYAGDMMLLRYLRARDHHLEKSYEMFLHSLAWRADAKPWAMENASSRTNKMSSDARIVGYDAASRVVVYSSFAKTVERTPADVSVNTTCMMEKAAACAAAHASGTVMWVNHFGGKHANGFSWRDCSPKFAWAALDIFSNHYPESLLTMIIVDPPAVFFTLWKMVKPLLPEKTQRKAYFVDSSKLDHAYFDTTFGTELSTHLQLLIMQDAKSWAEVRGPQHWVGDDEQRQLPACDLVRSVSETGEGWGGQSRGNLIQRSAAGGSWLSHAEGQLLRAAAGSVAESEGLLCPVQLNHNPSLQTTTAGAKPALLPRKPRSRRSSKGLTISTDAHLNASSELPPSSCWSSPLESHPADENQNPAAALADPGLHPLGSHPHRPVTRRPSLRRGPSFEASRPSPVNAFATLGTAAAPQDGAATGGSSSPAGLPPPYAWTNLLNQNARPLSPGVPGLSGFSLLPSISQPTTTSVAATAAPVPATAATTPNRLPRYGSFADSPTTMGAASIFGRAHSFPSPAHLPSSGMMQRPAPAPPAGQDASGRTQARGWFGQTSPVHDPATMPTRAMAARYSNTESITSLALSGAGSLEVCHSPAPLALTAAGLGFGCHASKPSDAWPIPSHHAVVPNPLGRQSSHPGPPRQHVATSAQSALTSTTSRIQDWMAEGFQASQAFAVSPNGAPHPPPHTPAAGTGPAASALPPSLTPPPGAAHAPPESASQPLQAAACPCTSQPVTAPATEASHAMDGDRQADTYGGAECMLMETAAPPGRLGAGPPNALLVEVPAEQEGSEWGVDDEPEAGAVPCSDADGKGWLHSSPHLLGTPSPRERSTLGADCGGDGGEEDGADCRRSGGPRASVRSSLLRAPPGSACTAPRRGGARAASSAGGSGGGGRELSCMSHSRRVSQVLAAATFKDTAQLCYSRPSPVDQDPQRGRQHRRQYSAGSDCSMGAPGDGGSTEKRQGQFGLCFASGGGGEAAMYRRVRNAGCTPAAGGGAPAGLLHCLVHRQEAGQGMEDDSDLYDDDEANYHTPPRTPHGGLHPGQQHHAATADAWQWLAAEARRRSAHTPGAGGSEGEGEFVDVEGLQSLEEFNQQLCKAAEYGNRGQADRLFQSLCDRAIAPDIITLNLLLRCMSKSAAHPDEAELLAREVCAAGGMSPNSTTGNLLREIGFRYEQLLGL
ncbi:MAG: hypothetical protein WDW36_001112 [Sanguina aurantia]